MTVSGGRAAELKDRIHSGQEDRRVGWLHFKTKLTSGHFFFSFWINAQNTFTQKHNSVIPLFRYIVIVAKLMKRETVFPPLRIEIEIEN